MADYDTYPNVGIDRADGLDGRLGSATPSGLVIVRNFDVDGMFFEEFPDSPQIERAEQGTWRHRFRCDHVTGMALLGTWGRGAYVVDSAGNLFRVLNVNLDRQPGDFWVFSMTTESLSFDTPPDEFEMDIVEINPSIEKHPRYAFLSRAQRRIVNSSFNATTYDDQTQFDTFIKQQVAEPAQKLLSISDNDVQTAMKELCQKKALGEETFYLPGFRVTWSRYYWKPQYLSPGGYIEDPITQGGLPYFFWSPKEDPANTVNTIFSWMGELNPQLYLDGNGNLAISWLRMADSVHFQRTWHRITSQWIGAPYAHWDGQIYTQGFSPYPPPYNPNFMLPF